MADQKYSDNANKGFGFTSRPAGHVDVSAGTEMPSGILSMQALAKGAPMAARAAINSKPEVVTVLGKAKLNEIGPATTNVREMIKRKR
jgi:hypothetical protein